MFGKRNKDHKHRFGEVPDADAARDPDDDLVEALIDLTRNRHAPLPEPNTAESDELDQASEPAEPQESSDELDEPAEPDSPEGSNELASRDDADDREVEEDFGRWSPPSGPAWSAAPTAAMLAEPEPSESEAPQVSDVARQVLNRERARAAESEAAMREAQDEAAALKAQLKQLQAELARRDDVRTPSDSGGSAIDELRSATERAETAESSALELQEKVSELAAELEGARADAVAAGVALERLERETADHQTALATAQERAERLAADVDELRAGSSRGPAEAQRLQREVEREQALLATVDQAQTAAAQVEAVLAENRRLASDLAANLQSQEAVVAALVGLQAEVTEQRAWFEAQLASVRATESEHDSVVDALQAAVKEREDELDVLRHQLLDVEAKRAEEAAAFVAALDGQ